jgi:hypothetical protein
MEQNDPCRHCICKGDIKKCEQTDCSIHNSWYVRAKLKQPANHPVEKIEFNFNAGNVTITDLESNPESYPHISESTQAPAESESPGASRKDAGTEVSG